MSVTPSACSVAAVVKMMASAIRFENPMPASVSTRMRSKASAACSGALTSGLRSAG